MLMRHAMLMRHFAADAMPMLMMMLPLMIDYFRFISRCRDAARC